MNFETLQKDMIAALKARDHEKKDTIGALVSAVKKLAIDEGTRDHISDELTDRAVMKELKAAKEQLESCPDSREDLKKEYQARYDLIASYAPRTLGKDEIRSLLLDKYAEVLATKNTGMIMKTVMPELKGKANGRDINEVVAELCK